MADGRAGTAGLRLPGTITVPPQKRAPMPATAGQSTADTRLDPQERAIPHRVLRREPPLPARLVETAAPGDRRRTAVLGAPGEHHEGEDDLLWPKLRERAAPGTEVVARRAHQHGAVADALAADDAASPRP